MSQSQNPPHGSSRAPWIVLTLLLGSYAYFFQGGGWNPNSRFDLTRALAEQHTIRIDAYRHNTADWAHRHGHFYTNKAPGFSLLSVPFYAAATALVPRLGSGPDPESEPEREGHILVARAYLTNVATNALPSALLGVLLFHVLGRLGAGDPAQRAWLCAAFGLGTLAFPYSTAYYAHQPAAVLSFAAFAALLVARDAAAPKPRAGWAALAGLAAGAAVVTELSALLTTAALGLVCSADRRGRRLLPWFVLGGAPMALLLGAYQQIAFGNPLETGYTYSNPRIVFPQEGRLFGVPTPERLYALLFSPYRGLFFSSPLLLLAPFGWRALRRRDAWAAALSIGVPAAFVLLFASFHGWRGGWTPGPRYLVPCLPFLFLAVAFAALRLRVLGAALAAVSVLIMLSISLVAVEVPVGFQNPLFEFVGHHLARGNVSVNPQDLATLMPPPGYRRLADVPQNASSFNLGEQIWPHSPLSVLPLLVLWTGLGFALWRLRNPAPVPAAAR